MRLLHSKFFLSCCAVVLLPLIIWSIYYVIPYQVFRFQTFRTVAKFDALNQKVLEEIPPPEGVKLIEKSVWGIQGQESIHGRILRLRYETVSGIMEDKLSYYNERLRIAGWKHKGKTYLYYKNTACITIVNSTEKLFTIDIWHDFWNQSFSPSHIPETWKFGPFRNEELGIANFIEFLGKGTVYRCPQ